MGRPPDGPGDALRGIHVLVVDDNEDARDLVRGILEYAGALVAVAGSAAEALQYTGRLLPDVVVCDVVMPDHDGYWLLERLRNADGSRGASPATIPVVAVTGHSEQHPGARVLERGFTAYLPKPIDPAELCRTVKAAASAR
jgi:CheY-like chemotaxis protein